MTTNRMFAAALALLLYFAAIARGAHDVWSATVVYIATLTFFLIILAQATSQNSPGIYFPLWTPSFVLMIVAALSWRISSNRSESFLAFMDAAAAMFTYVVAVNAFQSKEAKEKFLRWMVPCVGIQLLFCLAQLVLFPFKPQMEIISAQNPFIGFFFPTKNIFNPGKVGTLINANILTLFALPLAIIFMARWREERPADPKRAMFWGAGAAASIGCIALARSGSGLICLLLGFVLLSLGFRVRHRKFAGVALGVFIAVTLGVVLYKFLHVYSSGLEPGRNTGNRFFWWASALKMFADHPLTGIGIGTYPSAYLAYKIGGTENTLYAHSSPLTILAETGLMGFASAAYFLIEWVWRILADGVVRALERPEVSATAAMLAYACFNIGPEYLIILLMFAILFAMTIAPYAGTSSRLRPSVAILGAALGAGALPAIISPFLSSRSLVDGQMYVAMSDWPKAVKALKNAIAMEPDDWEPYRELARAEFEQGHFQQAVAFQQQAIERNRYQVALKFELETYQRRLR